MSKFGSFDVVYVERNSDYRFADTRAGVDFTTVKALVVSDPVSATPVSAMANVNTRCGETLSTPRSELERLDSWHILRLAVMVQRHG